MQTKLLCMANANLGVKEVLGLWAQIERDEQLRTFQAFQNRFRAPYEQSFSTNPLYYSLDVGPIHIIMLNAVRPRSPSHGPIIELTTPPTKFNACNP